MWLDDAARQLRAPGRSKATFISPDVFRPLIWDGLEVPALSLVTYEGKL